MRGISNGPELEIPTGIGYINEGLGCCFSRIEAGDPVVVLITSTNIIVHFRRIGSFLADIL